MREIEQRSKNLAKWANLLMGAAGIIAAFRSHDSALMLDGLFSGVNFIAAMIDGVLSAAAGAAFMGIALLKGTALSFLVPISDAIVVLGLTVYMIPNPIRSFIGAVKEVIGESAKPETLAQWRKEAITDRLATTPFNLLKVAVTKMGRAYFTAAYIRPEHPETVESLDAIKEKVAKACRNIHEPSRIEIIFTGTYPY